MKFKGIKNAQTELDNGLIYNGVKQKEEEAWKEFLDKWNAFFSNMESVMNNYYQQGHVGFILIRNPFLFTPKNHHRLLKWIEDNKSIFSDENMDLDYDKFNIQNRYTFHKNVDQLRIVIQTAGLRKDLTLYKYISIAPYSS